MGHWALFFAACKAVTLIFPPLTKTRTASAACLTNSLVVFQWKPRDATAATQKKTTYPPVNNHMGVS